MVVDWYQRFGMVHRLLFMAEQHMFTLQKEVADLSETLGTVYQIHASYPS
jgi:hypothetical protein